jgi:hypothetical protein
MPFSPNDISTLQGVINAVDSASIAAQDAATAAAAAVAALGLIAPKSSATATITRVATSIAATTLKVANNARIKLVVATEAGITYVKLGSAATTTDYSYYLPARSVLEIGDYTGIVTAIRASGSDNVQVTEY